MSEWKEILLHQISEVKGRVGWKGYTVKDLRESGALTIGAAQIDSDNKLNFSKAIYLSDEKYYESPEINVEEGDLLLVQRGSLGKLAIVDKNIGRATINPSLVILKNIRVNKRFLYYYLCSSEGQKLIFDNASQTGVPMISQEQILNFKLRFPSQNSEQTKIAKILSTADAVIEKTQAAIAKYKAIKQGMLQDLFTRGLMSEKVKVKSEKGEEEKLIWKLRPPYQDAPHLYKESKLGMIPKEWEEKILSSVVEIISGGTPSTHVKEYWNGEIPWLSVDDFNTGNRYATSVNKKITEKGLKNSATNFLLPGMLIISARGTVGVISQMKIPMTFNQSCYGLNSTTKYLENNFLYYFLIYYKIHFGFNAYGSVFDAITRSSFDDVFIPINKSSDEQKLIVECLTTIDNKLQTEQTYLQKMQLLKKGLMEDLLSGKKIVKVQEEFISQNEN